MTGGHHVSSSLCIDALLAPHNDRACRDAHSRAEGGLPLVTSAVAKTLGYFVMAAATVIIAFAVFTVVRYRPHVSAQAATLLIIIAVIYIAAGTWVSRSADSPRSQILAAGGGAGIALAAIEVANLLSEQFANLSAGARAIVPASTMGLMIVAFATAATSAFYIVRSAAFAIVNAIWAAFVAMSLTCATGICIILFASVNSSDAAAVAANLITNASTHMLVAPFVAAATGAIAYGAALALAEIKSRLAAGLLLGLDGALLFGGVAFLVLAASLARSSRPPFVMSGMLAAGLSLAIAPPLIGNLFKQSTA
jgi:hypothetical protein